MIRKSVINDYENIRVLIHQVHKLHYNNRGDIYNNKESFPKEYYYNVINDDNSFCYVYEEINKIGGVVIFTRKEMGNLPIFKKRYIYFIEDIVVLEEYKRKGIGKKLYEFVKNKAREENIDAIELNVWAFNKDAIKFYEAVGMSPKNIIYEDILK